MGFTLLAYGLQALTAILLRTSRDRLPLWHGWMRSLHIATGVILVGLVLLLLAIGIVGTLGHYGSLGHSGHLWAGSTVVGLVLASAWSASQIQRTFWARPLHVTLNGILLLALTWVSWTGWSVVQKYLP